jgi:hypothetical protein
VLLVDSSDFDDFASRVLARRDADCAPRDTEPVREKFNESRIRRALYRRRHDTHLQRSSVYPGDLVP